MHQNYLQRVLAVYQVSLARKRNGPSRHMLIQGSWILRKMKYEFSELSETSYNINYTHHRNSIVKSLHCYGTLAVEGEPEELTLAIS